ncbi:hypothetical protein L7F22_048822 [Adiantum nelumboides]|nr:hypothetical protein [Adiantum nelumboides]
MKERGKASKQLADANDDALSKSKWLDSAPWDKDELLDVLYWIRQAIGLCCGLLWGCIPLVGSFWIVLFVALSSAAIYCYYKVVLRVDEEDLGGHGTLLQEGMFTSATLFLLSWILVYSLLHF